MSFFKKWVSYPPEYDREVHGPYNPTIYYGKRDTPLKDVKIKELGAWIGRRNKTPLAIAQACSRAWLTYINKWLTPKKPGFAFLYHLFFVYIIYGSISKYNRSQHYKLYKYH